MTKNNDNRNNVSSETSEINFIYVDYAIILIGNLWCGRQKQTLGGPTNVIEQKLHQ